MRMSTKMRELKDQINAAISSLSEAIEAQDAAAADAARKNLDDLNKLYAAAEAEFNAKRGMDTDPDDGNEPNTAKKYDALTFYKAICHANMNDAEKKMAEQARSDYKAKFSEGTKSDGGYTVPEDLSHEIFESIRSSESVRNLVRVENVNTATGSRIFRSGDSMKLYNLAEYEEIKEMNSPKYDPVSYAQKKFAGIMQISSELLEDSFVNFKSEMITWLSECARNTENFEVLYGAGGEKHCEGIISTAGAYQEITGPDTLSIDFLRGVFSSLKSGYRQNASWVMNTDAFCAIHELKDGNGRSYIQPDPREGFGYTLFGRPIRLFDSVETDESNKTVILFGDFGRAYTLFARKDFGVSFTDIGAGAWETDSVKAKGIERFDGKIMDRSAMVVVRNFSVTPLTVTGGTGVLSGEITEATLKNLTKKQLLELAAEMNVSGVTEASTKDAIVTAIMAVVNSSDEESA